MKVKDCMSKDVCCVACSSNITDVAKLMSSKHIGCVPVCDDKQNVVGIVTDRDLILRCIACGKDANNTPVTDVMTTKVVNTTPETSVSEASKVMCDCQIRRLPVMQNNKVVGMLTIGDLAQNMDIDSEDVSYTMEQICSCNGNVKNAE